jgi:nicotinamide riboside kinase
MDPNNQYRNIYIIGPQSTGKTTLVNALEKAFASGDGLPDSSNFTRPAIIREVARTVLKTYNFTRDDITNSPTRALKLQELILKAQLKAEETALSENPLKSWFISDRSGLDPIVYAKLFVGEDAAQQMLSSDNWKALEERMKDGLVILCEADCAWLVDDGTRLMPKDVEDWLRVNSAFHEVLETLAIDKILMPKSILDLQQRVQVVLDAVHKGTNTSVQRRLNSGLPD